MRGFAHLSSHFCAHLCAYLCVLIGALTISSAAAETYPDKSVRIVVPSAAGGGVDVLARMIAHELAGIFNQPFFIENKQDASGIVGPQTVVGSKPDGYTLLFSASTLTIMSHLLPSMPFDPENDLVPITEVAKSPFVLCVNPNIGINTFAELVRYAKSKPGALRVGAANIGSPDHLALELLEQQAEIEVLSVPFKGGAPAMQAAMAGTVDIVMLPPVLIKGQVESGKLKALGTTSTVTLETMPSVPPIANLGVPGYEFYSWYGFWGPKGMPQDRVDEIQKATAKVLASPEIKRRFAELGLIAVGSNAAALRALVKSETTRYGALIKERKLLQK